MNNSILKKSYLLLSISIFMLLVACNNITVTKNIDMANLNTYFNKENRSFFQQYKAKDRNYYFYLEDGSDAHVENRFGGHNYVRISFPAPISDVDFSKAELYSGEITLGAESIDYIQLHTDTDIIIFFDEYIPFFDGISGVLDKEEYIFTLGHILLSRTAEPAKRVIRKNT